MFILLLYPKLLRKRVLKRITTMISLSMIMKWIINKTIKTVIEYVRDARNYTELSTYMTSFNFPKEPLISSPLYRWYPYLGILNKLTKVTNLVSDRAKLQDCDVIKVKITRQWKIKVIQMRKEIIFPKIFVVWSK